MPAISKGFEMQKEGQLVAIIRRLYRRRILMIFLIAIVLCGSVTGELLWWHATATATTYPGSHFNRAKNAIWIAHTWVGDYHTDDEYITLCDRLIREQILYVYVHVGPLDSDGTIPLARAYYADRFVQFVNSYAPQLLFYAWVGQIYGPRTDQIDLEQPQVREQVALTSAHFVTQIGFYGVHYDIEPVPNNDNHFLDLLDATRRIIGVNSHISVATPNWIPLARAADGIELVTGRENVWWTTYYYLKVSQYVDQIVVMLYNTGMPTAPMYQMLVEQETAHILRAVERGSASAEVVIGIPTFVAQSRAFHSSAENMRTGLNGVISGLNYGTYHTAFAGVAIYPEWLTTANDWATYDHLWLGKD
jgi:Glycosyl hydrolases family 18